MEHRRIKDGLAVSVLGLGCGPLGGLYDELPEEQAGATVAAALDAGITYFDAAPFYGMGLAEHRLGVALRRRRGEAIVSTKVGRLLRPIGRQAARPAMFRDALPFEAVYDYSRDGVLRSVEDSLQRMGTDHIEILYIHDVNSKWHGDAVETRFREVMEGGYRALDDLRAAGAIKAIGVGVNDPDILVRFAAAGDFDLFMLAGRYTLLDQSALDALFPVCLQKGIAVVVAGPFNSGILASGVRPGAKFFYADAPAEILDRTRRIEAICKAHGVPLATAALQFALRHPVVVSVATGMVSPQEVERNCASLGHAVPDALWSHLKDEGLLHPLTPVGPGAVGGATIPARL